MRAFLAVLAAWLLSATLASAQMMGITGGPFTVSGAAYSGPGDVVSGAAAWYGFRAYNAAYATAGSLAVNLRNTTSNEQCDFPVVAAGGLGVAKNCTVTSNGFSLATFCTSGCAITEAYDQTGNGNNVVNATAGNQPTVTVSCQNSLPCAVFNGTASHCLVASGSVAVTTPVSLATAINYTVLNTKQAAVDQGPGTSGAEIGAGSTSGDIFIDINAAIINQAESTATWYAQIGVGTGTTGSSVNANGTGTTGGTSALSQTQPMAWGCTSNNAQNLNGKSSEAGLWSNVTFNSTQITNMTSNIRTYYSF